MSRKEKKDKETAAPPQINQATAKQLASFIARIERLDDEAASLKADRAEVLREANGLGFDPKELDAIVKMKRKDPDNEKIKTSVRDVYLRALELDLGELGRWARERSLAESSVRTQAVVATIGAQTQQMTDAFAVAHGLDEGGKSAARLREMVREDGGTRTTVRINGGPEVPLETLQKAVKRVKPGRGGDVIGAMEQAVAEELAEQGAAP